MDVPLPMRCLRYAPAAAAAVGVASHCSLLSSCACAVLVRMRMSSSHSLFVAPDGRKSPLASSRMKPSPSCAYLLAIMLHGRSWSCCAYF